MADIRRLRPEDFETAALIFAEAYPGMKVLSPQEREGMQERLLKFHQDEPTATFYGLFRGEHLAGIMCLHDFSMNFRGTRIPAGGVGQVAVHMAYKKEHVAKEMMLYFLRHYRDQGTPFVALYPFRPDFYRQMGFGYGTKMNQYRVKPTAFPRGPSKARVRYLTGDDRRALVDCYDRFAERTHGMMAKSQREITRLFESPKNRLVGFEKEGRIQGYLFFTWEHGDTWLLNAMNVTEFIYETGEALSELMTFLHSQADQVHQVIVNTQDEDFHFLLLDPRNGSDRLIPDVYHETNAQGVGLMYRVIDVRGLFDRLIGGDFGSPAPGSQPFTLKLTVQDSFLPENAASTLLGTAEGCLDSKASADHDVEIKLDVAELSSLVAGTVSFTSLYRYGLAHISDSAYVDRVDRLFAVERKPMCTTPF